MRHGCMQLQTRVRHLALECYSVLPSGGFALRVELTYCQNFAWWHTSACMFFICCQGEKHADEQLLRMCFKSPASNCCHTHGCATSEKICGAPHPGCSSGTRPGCFYCQSPCVRPLGVQSCCSRCFGQSNLPCRALVPVRRIDWEEDCTLPMPRTLALV